MEGTLELTPRQARLVHDACARAGHRGSVAALVATLALEPHPVRPTAGAPGGGGGRIVRPGEALVAALAPGDTIRIEQVEGCQCVDVALLAADDPRERLGAARTRSLAGLSPTLGATLVSNPPFERPLARIVADSAPGHDLAFPACSAAEHAAAGVDAEPSCAGLELAALARLGLGPEHLPDPLNLWFRPVVAADGGLGWQPTASGPGDHVVLAALRPLHAIVNPCVSDVFGCSAYRPRPIRVDAPGTAFAVGAPIAPVLLADALPPGVDPEDARAALMRFGLAQLAGGR